MRSKLSQPAQCARPARRPNQLLARRASAWELLTFGVVILFILFGISSFFIHKFGGLPVVRSGRDFSPTERGVLPKGTFFYRGAPLQNRKLEWRRFLVSPTLAATLVPVIETKIISPIKPNQAIETDRITLEFSGQTTSDLKKDPVSFEYMLFPQQRTWTKTSSKKQVFTRLERGKYFFFVRAKTKTGYTDPTPALLPFEIRLSSFYHSVSVSISGGRQLQLRNISKAPVPVTGWKIIGLFDSHIIPGGVRLVDEYLSDAKQNIILQPGEILVVHRERSPIGINFKTNRCFAFLQEAHKFSISGSSCRAYTNEELFKLRRSQPISDRCLQFVQANRCRRPTDKQLLTFSSEYNCQRFILDHLNYRGCLTDLSAQPNFFDNYWHVYLSTTQLHASRYEELKILDQEGLLVFSRKFY